MADHEKRKRNEVRRFVASTAEKVTLGAVGFGVLRPVFDASVDAAWLTFAGGFAFGLLSYVFALYILNGMEDDE